MSRQQHRLAHVLTGTVPRSPMAAADAAAAAAAARVPRRVGLLGLGAIGEVVAKALLRQPGAVGCPPQGESPEPAGVEGAALCAILVSDTAKHASKPWLPAGVVLTADPEAFFAAAPEVIVEAAGQPTVRSFVICQAFEIPFVHGFPTRPLGAASQLARHSESYLFPCFVCSFVFFFFRFLFFFLIPAHFFDLRGSTLEALAHLCLPFGLSVLL